MWQRFLLCLDNDGGQDGEKDDGDDDEKTTAMMMERTIEILMMVDKWQACTVASSGKYPLFRNIPWNFQQISKIFLTSILFSYDFQIISILFPTFILFSCFFHTVSTTSSYFHTVPFHSYYFHAISILFPCYFHPISILFPYYFHGSHVSIMTVADHVGCTGNKPQNEQELIASYVDDGYTYAEICTFCI